MPLYVVSTPIGNLEEASPRMCRILQDADLVLCEDTRRTRALLSALDLSSPKLMSCHVHNEESRLDEIVELLSQGNKIAMVSDAGTPGLSDPGGFVVQAAHEANIPVHVVGGPSSITAAISVSGLPATPFHFLGFLPRKSGQIATVLTDCSQLAGTLVFLVAGRRLSGVIEQLSTIMPEREVVVCRELTKKFEQIVRGRPKDLPEIDARGEVVMVVGPGEPVAIEAAEVGPTLKTIAAALSERWGCKKSEAYSALVALEEGRD